MCAPAVIELPDDDMGQRVHAIIEADDSLDLDHVQQHLRDRLAVQAPRSYEVVDEPLRDAGKVRRTALKINVCERTRGCRTRSCTDVGGSALSRMAPRPPPGEVGHETGDVLCWLLGALAHPEAAAPSASPTSRRELAPLLHGELTEVDERGDRLAIASSTTATCAANSSSRQVPPPKRLGRRPRSTRRTGSRR